MADLIDLVMHLSTGRSIAWVGSGPSVEMGLPNWRNLANKVLEECRKQQRGLFAQIERRYRQGLYPEMFDLVVRDHGRDFLNDVCSDLLTDPGTRGRIYSQLARIDFLSYFTTNYDDILGRHLNEAGRATQLYLNSEDDLRAVDVDVTPALVKLHGAFSNPESVILTKSDYQDWYISGKRESFQTFLKSYLSRDRIIFVGYSLSDPEILNLQERLAVNLKREVRPLALMADASEQDVADWRSYFNIDILPYRTHQGDHRELETLLESAAQFLAVGEVPKARSTEQDLRQVQGLYMWYRFSPLRAEQSSVDALESVILSLCVDQSGSISADSVKKLLVEAGFNFSVDTATIDAALGHLENQGWLEIRRNQLAVSEEGKGNIELHQRRFRELLAVFQSQLKADLPEASGMDTDSLESATQIALNTLIDFFELRGQELLSMVFDDEPITQTGVLQLIQTISRRANEFDEPETRRVFISFMLDLLVNPTGVYDAVLSYFGRAFFCVQALRLDPNVEKLIRDLMAERILVVDDNVLIPLCAKSENRHAFIRELLQSAKQQGLALCTTQSFVDAVCRQADWARNLINDYGAQSQEVLDGATGGGYFTQNAFLSGFIAQDPDSRNRVFLDYLQECFGGPYYPAQVLEFLKSEFEIRVVSNTEMEAIIALHETKFNESVDQISEWNQARREENRKGSGRIDRESEAYILLAHWSTVQTIAKDIKESRVTFLSLGSSVPRLVRIDESSTGIMSVVTPQALLETISCLQPTEQVNVGFHSLMLSSYFRMAESFVDTEKYRRFFRPLINKARENFDEHRDLLEAVLDLDLSGNPLESVPMEDWPRTVSALEGLTARRVSSQQQSREGIEDELTRLRILVDEYEDRERRRREYVAAQRTRDRQRRRSH